MDAAKEAGAEDEQPREVRHSMLCPLILFVFSLCFVDDSQPPLGMHLGVTSVRDAFIYSPLFCLLLSS